MKNGFAILCLLTVAATNSFSRESAFQRISGPYLGQKPPGLTPEIFAPGIVSTGLDELNSAFSPDGGEFYFCTRNIQGAVSVFQVKREKGAWSEPRLLPFASRFGDIDASISPAGDALLFSSLRTLPGSQEPKKDNDLWMAARKGNGLGDIYWVDAGIIEPMRLQALAASAPAMHKAGREPLTLTRVANSGVMLASGGTKVLIDALFDKPNPDYRAPAPDTLEKIMKGAEPFAGVDVVLVTHDHPDHFSAPLAVRYLEAFPKAVLVAPADAVVEMRQEASDWTAIAPRVISFDIEVDEKETRDLPGISLTAFRTRHSGGQQETSMNLMYLVRFNGWSIFHEGDSEATNDEYRGFGLVGTPIDLALVHFWFPLAPETAKFLQEMLKPEHIGLTHLPIRLEGDAPGKIDMVRRNYKDIFLLLPGMPVKTFQPGK